MENLKTQNITELTGLTEKIRSYLERLAADIPHVAERLKAVYINANYNELLDFVRQKQEIMSEKSLVLLNELFMSVSKRFDFVADSWHDEAECQDFLGLWIKKTPVRLKNIVSFMS